MAYKIQRLNLGGILDQAVAITKDHFRLLFGIMLCLMIPFQLIQGLALLATLDAGEVMPNLPIEEQIIAPQGPMGFASLSVFLFASLAGLVVMPVTNAAVIDAIARVYLGQEASAIDSIKRGFTLLLPLIWASILYYLAFFVGLMLLIVPGFIFLFWFCLYQHVIVIEGVKGSASLKRSRELMRSNFLTLLALGLLVFLIVGLVSAAGEALIPQAHVKLIVSVVLQAVMTIFATAAFVVFYFSCRCGVENFDLQYLAEAAGVEYTEPDELPPGT